MGLVQQFPNEHRVWVENGGDENNFRLHLLHLGILKPTADDVKFVADEAKGAAERVRVVLANYFQAQDRVVEGLDVSSFQPADLTNVIASSHAEFVLVKLYLPEERPPQETSLNQIASVQRNGKRVGGYVWAYADLDAVKTVDDAIDLAVRGGVQLRTLWLDVETYEGKPGPGMVWLRKAADRCRARGVQAGIYTGKWYWDEYMKGVTGLADLPLWLAQYDNVPDLNQVKLFGGWTRAVGKQYRVDSIDHDVFLESFV